MPYHNCPKCTCLTPEQERDYMRYCGHTCVWNSEELLKKYNGYLNINCIQCEKERKLK